MSGREGPTVRRALRRTLVATGGLAVGVGAAVAAERHLVRKAHARPDPDQSELLDERPGEVRMVRSFDGTALAVKVVGPKGAPTLVFAHGFSLNMTAWHFQWKHF